MATTASIGSRRRNEAEFNSRDLGLKARITRENSSSHIREDAKSFRSNITISSTASSPGYTLREEIDPSTYSFTTALKALQAKTVYSWEYMSADGLALNSKWNEAEKYICNPKSGEVPLECLSAKSPSFRSLTSRISMSAPLFYPSHSRNFPKMPSISTLEDEDQVHQIEVQEKKKRSMTRDIGTQSSTPAEVSSGSPSPAPTPSIEETPRKPKSPFSTEKINYVEVLEKEETGEKEDVCTIKNVGERKRVKKMVRCSKCRGGGSGCLSWSLWLKRRQREKHKDSKKKIFFYHVSGC